MLVFVYGTLKRGYGNHRLLGTATFVGTGRTAARFDMTDVGFPYAFAGGQHQVAGEVYAVDLETLRRLDGLEGEGHHYDRTVQIIDMDNGTTEMAGMYVIPKSRAGRYHQQGGRARVIHPNDAGLLEWGREDRRAA